MQKLIKTLFLCLCLWACSDQNVITYGESGKTKTYKVGQHFVLTLPENPTTGYVWNVQTEPSYQTAISKVSDRFIVPKTRMVGSGGTHVFVFNAISPGIAQIKGYHARPWEQNASPEAAVEYNIIIR